jgi:hypothetical protein
VIEMPIAVFVLAKKNELTIVVVLVNGGTSPAKTNACITKYPKQNKKTLRKADRTNSVNCAVMMLGFGSLVISIV